MTTAAPDRARLTALVSAVTAWDEQERGDIRWVVEWVAGGAPLYRTRAPDAPPTHLVSYFVVMDPRRGRMLLLSHRKARSWLPAGGHVEPGEDPWQAVRRECREELGLDAVAAPVAGPRPVFVTVTPVPGPAAHVDVSLWYLLHADAADVTWYDPREFSDHAWLTCEEVLGRPVATMDPHMHRFVRKLTAILAAAPRPGLS